MSLSFNFKQKNIRNCSKKPLFFVILVVLIVIVIFIGKGLENPKISQNLPISYYIELDLGQFNQVSGLWLENSPNRQKLLDLWNQYLETFAPKLPEGLFAGKVSLIGLNMAKDLNMPIKAASNNQTEDINIKSDINIEIIFSAAISNEQIALNYLKKLGSLQYNKELEITVITLKKPILGRNKYYYRIKDNQIAVSSNADLVNSPSNNLKFPEKGLFHALSVDSKFLKIFAKSPDFSFLGPIILKSKEPNWLFAELEPDKLVITFESSQKDEFISRSWMDYISDGQFLAIFSQDIKDILSNNQLLFFIAVQQEEIFALAKNNQSLFVLKPKNADFILKPSESNYCLVVSNPNNLTLESPEIKKIINNVKNFFAQKFPSEKITYLPDNSTITELISIPEMFNFQEKSLFHSKTGQTADININYLQKPNLEFAYAFLEDKIFFSDSIALLEQTIVQKSAQNTEFSLFECANSESIPSELIIFNSGAVFQEKYGIKQVIITNERTCAY